MMGRSDRQAIVNVGIWNPIQIAAYEEGPIPMIQHNAKYFKWQMCSVSDSLSLCEASNVCYSGGLGKIGEQFDEDFYIFQSTEVEVILMPISYMERFCHSVQGILGMQMGVSQVWETLSENVYLYRKETGIVEPRIAPYMRTNTTNQMLNASQKRRKNMLC